MIDNNGRILNVLKYILNQAGALTGTEYRLGYIFVNKKEETFEFVSSSGFSFKKEKLTFTPLAIDDFLGRLSQTFGKVRDESGTIPITWHYVDGATDRHYSFMLTTKEYLSQINSFRIIEEGSSGYYSLCLTPSIPSNIRTGMILSAKSVIAQNMNISYQLLKNAKISNTEKVYIKRYGTNANADPALFNEHLCETVQRDMGQNTSVIPIGFFNNSQLAYIADVSGSQGSIMVYESDDNIVINEIIENFKLGKKHETYELVIYDEYEELTFKKDKTVASKQIKTESYRRKVIINSVVPINNIGLAKMWTIGFNMPLVEEYTE